MKNQSIKIMQHCSYLGCSLGLQILKSGQCQNFAFFYKDTICGLGSKKAQQYSRFIKMHSVFAAMLPFFQIMPRSKRQYRSRKYVASYKYCNFSPKINQGPSLYYVSKRTGWVDQENGQFCCIYAGQVGGCGPKRPKIC